MAWNSVGEVCDTQLHTFNMILGRGTRLGRYEILAPMGKGGMGEVYRAKDSQLDREVAIKVLPEHLAQDATARRRFEREAKAVAALSHPNILAIHDSSTDHGIAYAVMELLEGETLRDRLKRSALPSRTALEITIAVAEGLAAAHTKGIIHRDLKPENIFVTKDNRVKILDFGLARFDPVVPQEQLTEAPTKSQLTEEGSVMGTVPYMSPEQLRGESLDGRTDIFSLGSILYEMLSGRRPFHGNNSAETIAAILKEDPPKPPDVPPEVLRIIDRCLEKNPEQRFHSAHDLAFALKDMLHVSETVSSVAVSSGRAPLRKAAWISALILGIIAIAVGGRMVLSRKQSAPELPALKIESVAVLPLANLSKDPEQEYFADGMTEELIAKLAGIASLRVISRTSVMEYKNARKPLPVIAKELNVDAIVEGSILQAGNRVRITAQLIHAATDHHLWASSYEREMEDIFALQNEVASAIAREVQVKLAPAEAAQLASAPKANPQAYQAYLRGLSYAEGEITPDSIRVAVEMFQRAVDLDPNFASAFAELSRAQSFLYFTLDRNPEWLKKSKASLDRAFELQLGFAQGHVAQGFYYYRGFRDYERALQEFSIAQKTLPNNKIILGAQGAIYRRQGRFEESVAAQQKLLKIDPRDAQLAFDLSTTYAYLRNYEEAQRYCELSISLGPDNENGYVGKVLNVLRWKGDTRTAREILERMPSKPSALLYLFTVELYDRNYQAALEAISDSNVAPPMKAMKQGIAYRLLNQKELARTSFETARDRIEKKLAEQPDNYRLRSMLGVIYANLGQKEKALQEGKRAVELLPISIDAIWGPDLVENMAEIYILLGDPEAAIDQIEYLLSIPSSLSVPVLRIDPRFDPLRDNPRFRKLLASV